MDVTVADQRILLFTDQLTAEEAQKKAWDKKTVAFGTLSQFTSFLSKPKDDDFKLIYEEHRFQPFWHVAAKSHYVYDRSCGYQVPVSGSEVKSVTLLKSEYETNQNHIHISVIEHCIQDETDEVFVDGVSGKTNMELKRYLSLSPRETKGDLEKYISKDAITVPPQTRVSAIMRDALAKMIKGIQADTILAEKVEVTCVDLYYHPVYAFKYQWISKNKEAIVEVDGVTGEISTGNRTFAEYMGKVLNRDFLFDVGADAAGMFIPGGSIAVKVAKRYIDTKQKK
jgi:hypothetical protein